MRPKLHLFIQHFLLCLLVALIYSPAFQAEPCLLDDVAMLKGMQGNAQLDLKALLTPNTSQFNYYRPLIGVSFWFSQSIWHAQPHAMHIENVIIHTLNTILLFWLIRILLISKPLPTPLSNPLPSRKEGLFQRFLPFLAALLFAVHPIASESVNWISGRTDLIAGSCLLGAAIALVVWRQQSQRWWLLPLALLLLAGGIMTKEVAWGFLLVLPFFLTEPYDANTLTLTGLFRNFSNMEKLLLLAGIALCFLLATLLLSFWPVIVMSYAFGLLVFQRKPRRQPLSRKLLLLLAAGIAAIFASLPLLAKLGHQQAAVDAYHSTFSRTLLLISLDLDNSITMFSAAIAFYIKKFFLPLPLSFAITDIAAGYLFAGIGVIILITFLAAWRSSAAILFLTGVALLLPALPLVHGEITWASYAERYAYISSAFWTASLTVGCNALKRPLHGTLCTGLCVLLILMATMITFNRSNVWQSNVTLFADTVSKSPAHLKSRVLYMTALAKSGKLAEALEQYRIIRKTWDRIPVNYVNILALQLYQAGMTREAWDIVNTCLTRPLPPGLQHPFDNPEWRKLYQLHHSLKQDLIQGE